MNTTDKVGPASKMSEVLAEFPGAQRALFRQYHIGGCSNCGFSPEETLQELCERNGKLDVNQVLEAIALSHEQDEKIFIEPKELADLIEREKDLHLVDVRSREEFEAVHINGAALLTQDVMRKVLGDGSNTRPVVIVDHQGKKALDAAAYFIGHGLQNVRCLRGGIDAWAAEVDASLPRYKVG